ncbi:hypothetical protein VNO78_08701 [Psophocarpus tetragonolobus]|uniref:Uncharacterized protein n=1 Tax=Psophocarpus tetragonolobus TaxID=3891 RepID=A0AAN9XTZ9_PSOTE
MIFKGEGNAGETATRQRLDLPSQHELTAPPPSLVAHFHCHAKQEVTSRDSFELSSSPPSQVASHAITPPSPFVAHLHHPVFSSSVAPCDPLVFSFHASPMLRICELRFANPLLLYRHSAFQLRFDSSSLFSCSEF